MERIICIYNSPLIDYTKRISNFDTQLSIKIIIKEAIAIRPIDRFGLVGGNGSIPILMAAANCSRSSSMVTIMLRYRHMS